MQHSFIYNGKRFMYDLSSGEVFEYSRLEKELIPFMQRLQKPLPAVCPSGLRYSLAKYEVSEIYESYDRLLSLINTKKLIFTSPTEIHSSVRLNASCADIDVLIKAFSSAVNSIPTIEALTVLSADQNDICGEIRNRFSFIEIKTA